MAHDTQGATPRIIPVGLEQVLYTAAKDPEFYQALLADREAAVATRGWSLRASELAMLRAIPAAQLEAAVQGMDTSADNVPRRKFMRAVAAGATTVSMLAAACGEDTVKGTRPDQGADQGADQGVDLGASRGIRPDMPDPAKEAGPADIVVTPEAASYGIRPKG